MSDQRDFRLDINALRALAVTVVTLHHFRVGGFEAGFIGVDIFFVISGYLMTKIVVVVDAASQGRLSVLQFYWARVKRIVPAIVALCAVLLAAGYALLLPSDYRLLAKHVGSSLGFFSNSVFYGEAGYFDVASHDKWMLHTWSLSVEWQFYLLFPLLMMALLRWIAPRHWLWVVGTAAAAGLAYCIARAATDPSAAFFLLPARAWEMLAGAFVLLLARHPTRPVAAPAWASLAGLVPLGISMLTIDTRTAWPGAMTILPVLGTAFLLLGTLDGPVVRNAAVQALGRWSYSIYLWHWPVVVAAAYLSIDPSPVVTAAGIGLSIVVGALSYRFVEVPARQGLGSLRLGPRALSMALVWAGLVGAAAAIYLSNGVDGRDIPIAARLADQEKSNNVRLDQSGAVCRQPIDGSALGCVYGQGPVGVALVGDSHSSAVVTAVAQALSSQSASVVHYAFTACPTVLGLQHLNPRMASCPQFTAAALKKVADLPPAVPLIVVNRWSSYIKGPEPHDENPGQRFIQFRAGESDSAFLASFTHALSQTLCPMARGGRRVIMLKPVPEMRFDVPSRMARSAMITGRPIDVSLAWSAYQSRHAEALGVLDTVAQGCGIELLDPTDALCRVGRCAGSTAGRPLYFDDDHLSEFGNKLLVPMFNQALIGQAPRPETQK